MRERLRRVALRSVEVLKHLVLGAAALAVVFLALQSLVGASGGHRRSAPPFDVIQRWMSGLQKLNVRDAVDTFYWEKGRLPEDLSELVREGILKPPDGVFPWGEPFLYETYASGLEEGFFVFEPMR